MTRNSDVHTPTTVDDMFDADASDDGGNDDDNDVAMKRRRRDCSRTGNRGTTTTTTTANEDDDADAVELGYFSTLPVDLVMDILRRLDGVQLAMASCACKEFERLIRSTDDEKKDEENSLWYRATCDLESARLVRRDLVQKPNKFTNFTWKELYVWRLHTLKRCARAGTLEFSALHQRAKETATTTGGRGGVEEDNEKVLNAPLEPSTSAIDEDKSDRQFARHKGRLAVLDRDQLFTCDPVAKAGIVCKIHDVGINRFVPRTLAWAPKGELLAVAISIEGPEASKCFNKVLLCAPNQLLKTFSKRRGGTPSTTAQRGDDGPYPYDPSKGGRYSGPPLKNILALPPGVQCSHMIFAPCGTKINFLHRDRMETALFSLDCATSLTSLYGPSNGDKSPVPPPSEFITKHVSGGEELLFANSPNSHNHALVLDGTQETFMLNLNETPAQPLSEYWPEVDEFDDLDSNMSISEDGETRISLMQERIDNPRPRRQRPAPAAPVAPQIEAPQQHIEVVEAVVEAAPATPQIMNVFRDDMSESTGGRDFNEVASRRPSRWWQKPFIIGRSLLQSAMVSKITGLHKLSEPQTPSIQVKRKRSGTGSENSDTTCRRQSSWWSNIPNFRKLTDIKVHEMPKQPLSRVYSDQLAKMIQWVPPVPGDRVSRGFWLIPSSIPEFYTPFSAFLIMAPAPSDETIARGHIYPFLGYENEKIFEALKECMVTEITPHTTYQDPDLEIPFLFAGAPGGRLVAWSLDEGVFARVVNWKLDDNGDSVSAPTMGLEHKVLDFDMLMGSSTITGENEWNKKHDEQNMRNYPAFNGSRRIAVLSVTNRVVAYTIAALQWSPSGKRLLVLLATHLAHEFPSQAGDYYTVHQWVCWDPAKEVLDPNAPVYLPPSEIKTHGCLSFGGRFIPSETFATQGVEKMEQFPQGHSLWSPDETAVVFSLSMPGTSTSGERNDYVVIQNFPQVNLEHMKAKSEQGKLPPLQQTEDVNCLPYYLNYMSTPFEYVCEGSYAIWSPGDMFPAA